jgi:GTP pyrophosphokinase
MAFRVVVQSVADCYRVLGVIHSRYAVVPGRFKDYISTPKPNGYRSLHTGVIGPERQRIEIQVRTEEMHQIAELGVAAHWRYAQGADRVDGRQYRWLRELLDILEHASSPEEFLEHTKLEMFHDQVFCFTPKGDIITLPRGATAVDFAYAVHSEVGDTCVGSKINGRLMPLRTQLKNGDQVEVLVSRNGTPSPEWERFVVSGKARARIRRYVRSQKHKEYADLGRAILQKAFRQEGFEFTEKAVSTVLEKYKHRSNDDIYAAIGEGTLAGREVVHAIFPGTRKPARDRKILPFRRSRAKILPTKADAVPITGLSAGIAIHFAGCCHPLPGDRIVGIITTGKGVTIHTIDCETLQGFADSPERWLDVSWSGDAADEGYVGRVSVLVANEPGSLGGLSTIIGKSHGNISNLKITNRSTDFFEMLIDVEVRDAKHLTDIIAALRASSFVNSVERARG